MWAIQKLVRRRSDKRGALARSARLPPKPMGSQGRGGRPAPAAPRLGAAGAEGGPMSLLPVFLVLTAIQVIIKPSLGLWWTDLICVVGLLALCQWAVWATRGESKGD